MVRAQGDFTPRDWEEVLLRLEREVAETLDLDQVLLYIMDVALRATQADDAGIGLLNEDMFTVSAAAGGHYQVGMTFPRTTSGIAGRVAHTLEHHLTRDVHSDPDYVALNPRTRAQMTLAIVWRGAMMGVLALETHQPDYFTDNSFRFMGAFIDRAALAIDHALAHRRLRQQNEALHALNERLRTVEQLKSTLLDIAAHDLRTPITSIQRLIKIILRDPAIPPERIREMLEGAQGSAQESIRILDDLTVLRRVQRGQTATYHVFDFGSMVSQVVARFQADVIERGHTLTVNISPQPCMVLGEPMLLNVAVANLIDNAVKYTPEKGAIAITCTADETAIILTVRDSGYGISATALPDIFDAFYRAPEGMMHGIRGTGLGLHIVQQVIRQHEGTVNVESAPGVGTTFTVRLPRFNLPSAV